MKQALSALLLLASFATQAGIYLDARLGSVIGGKHSSNDGNLPFLAEGGYYAGDSIQGRVFVSHRSNADKDGVLPDGGSEYQNEFVGVGVRANILEFRPSVTLYVGGSIAEPIRHDEEGTPYWYEAGVSSEIGGGVLRLGWTQRETINGSYALGSLGISFQFNLWSL